MASPDFLSFNVNETALFEAQEKLLNIPAVDSEHCEDFRVVFMDFEAVVKASGHFEAAFKTAVVLHEQRVKESLLKVKRRNGDSFEYHITSSCTHDGFVYPLVRLSSMLVAPRSDTNNESDERSAATNNMADTGREDSDSDLLYQALRNVFGYPSFRPQQRETITATMARKNVLAILSTGGGKSLTFMLPAAISSRPTIVISPIRSLIEDLHDRATNLGLKSCIFLVSGVKLSPDETLEIKGALQAIRLAEEREELAKREERIAAIEKRVKKQEGQLKNKAKRLKKSVMEAKRVAAQLRLMAGQLDRLADKILNDADTSL